MGIKETNTRGYVDENGDYIIKHEKYPYESRVRLYDENNSELEVIREEYIGPVVIERSNLKLLKDNEVVLERVEQPGGTIEKETIVQINKETELLLFRRINGVVEGSIKIDSNGEIFMENKDGKVAITTDGGDLTIEVEGNINFIKK